jgi:hypothetical protein
MHLSTRLKLCKNGFWKRPYSDINWQSQSPDFNSIENVQAIFKRQLNLYSIPLNNLHELWSHVLEVYATITIDECRRLYASMPA